ncbi:MAG: hypothetical protein D6719_01235 [Candidatus Dadabacteria bacterium]|nr:MAG: hypothetical protein D6719_01235 [Candidatus Dadabacteria bacterium]
MGISCRLSATRCQCYSFLIFRGGSGSCSAVGWMLAADPSEIRKTVLSERKLNWILRVSEL